MVHFQLDVLWSDVERCQVKQYAGGTAMFHAADSVSEVLENDLDSVAR